MKSKRGGPLWTVSIEDLRAAVDQSCSMTEVLLRIGCHITSAGGYYWRNLRNRCERDGVDLSGLVDRRKAKQPDVARTTAMKNSRPLSNILVRNSDYTATTNLKRRLFAEGVLENRCSVCGRSPIWMGRSLILVLDHINGIRNDNRLSNLRVLCPNCNSQTDTFCGRNKMYKRLTKKCSVCGKTIGGNGTTGMCRGCLNSRRDHTVQRKVKNRPPVEELASMIASMSWVAIGRAYGVSDNAVRKWARLYGLIE